MSNQRRAELIVEGVVRDLSGRKGLEETWDSISPSIRAEISDKWASIIADSLPDEDTAALRDTFAAAALTGVMAMHPLASDSDQAARAYRLADAMLKAREGK